MGAIITEIVSQNGLFIPAYSPDLIVPDLGYFNPIQSLQQEEKATSINELVDLVRISFKNLTSHKINSVFVALMRVMELVMKPNGSNNFHTFRRENGTSQKLKR